MKLKKKFGEMKRMLYLCIQKRSFNQTKHTMTEITKQKVTLINQRDGQERYTRHTLAEVVEMIRKQDDGSYIIDCSEDLDELYELFGLDEDEESDAATISGWVLEQTGRIPMAGDHFTYEDLNVTIVKVSRRRVLEIRVIQRASGSE